MSTKRSTPYQAKHSVEFALEISTRSVHGDVTSVSCQFCIYRGREAKLGAKRKRTENVKSFTSPFRPELYRKHHDDQHPTAWTEYQELSPEQQVTFFNQTQRLDSTLHRYVDFSIDCLKFKVCSPIVSIIVAELLLEDERDDMSSTSY